MQLDGEQTGSDATYGYEYLWESGAFVLHRARPEERFPGDCDIINRITGVEVFDVAFGHSTNGAELITRMRDEGVPLLDDVSQLGLQFRQPVLDYLSGKVQVSIEDRERLFKDANRRIKEVNERIRQQHLARHPEQQSKGFQSPS